MLAAIVTALLAANPAPSSWNYKFDTAGHPSVDVSNINGQIRISPSSSNQVTVAAQRRDAGGRDPWTVEAKQNGDSIRIQVCCGPCKESHWGHDCSDGGVDLTVTAPAASSLDVSSVNAAVRISGITGEQEISTVAGALKLTGSTERLKVSAVSATVDLAPRVLASTEVSTVSGAVKLKLPQGSGAHVSFTSVGGKFNGQPAGLGSITKTFGDGKTDVSVNTVGGELTVDQGS